MDSKILLGRILQVLIELNVSQYEKYNKFKYVNHCKNNLTVTRENGNDVIISFAKLLHAIKSYQENIELYDDGPSALRSAGIKHINSPVHSLLHLISKDSYL